MSRLYESLRKATEVDMKQLRELAEKNEVAAAICDFIYDGKLTSPTVCEEAEQLIFGDREKTYGDPSKNLSRIAELWTYYLQERLRRAIGSAISFNSGMETTPERLRQLTQSIDLQLGVTNICHMMQLLKWARDENEPKRDNVVDDIGYAALVDRCRAPAPKMMTDEVQNFYAGHPEHGNVLDKLRKRKPPKRATKPILKTAKRKR